jgi:hypothetical protein
MKAALVILPSSLRDRLGTAAPKQLSGVGNAAPLNEPLLGRGVVVDVDGFEECHQ